jgi:hypothetical protein
MNTIINYFEGCITPDQIKMQYRELAFAFHPDMPNGNLEVMKEVNNQYHTMLKGRDNVKSFNADNQEYTYKYDREVEQAVLDKIGEFLARHLEGIDLLLIGNWLWITGETREVKEPLKELKFKWHGQKKCWFWHSGGWKGRGNKTSLSAVARKYGYKKYASELQSKIC